MIHFAGCVIGGSGDRIQDETPMGITGDPWGLECATAFGEGGRKNNQVIGKDQEFGLGHVYVKCLVWNPHGHGEEAGR